MNTAACPSKALKALPGHTITIHTAACPITINTAEKEEKEEEEESVFRG